MLYLKCKGQVMSVDVDERIADQYINVNTVHFEFCERWADMVITAQFTQNGKTYNKVVDVVTNTVIMPNEIVAGKVEISAFGEHPITGARITTIPVKKTIDKSGFVGDGETPIPPTPDLYAQLLEKVNKTAIPHIGANGNWWFDDWDSGVAATAEVDAARRAAVNEINRVAANQMLEMDNKFANTMKDIPETYTELDADVKSLKDTIAESSVQIDVGQMTDGYYISRVDGNTRPEQTSAVTGFVSILPGKKIRVGNVLLSGNRSVCAYDANKALVSALASGSNVYDAQEIVVEVPENACYIRATSPAGSAPTIEYASIVSKEVAQLRNELDSTVWTDSVVEVAEWNPGYIRGNGTTITASDAYAYTGYIGVYPGKDVVVSKLYSSAGKAVHFYDLRKQYVSSADAPDINTQVNFSAKVPDGAYYMRFTNLAGNDATVTFPEKTDRSQVVRDVYERYNALTDGYVNTPLANATRYPAISIIDDDTRTPDAVRGMHDLCNALGFKCSFAVLTANIESADGFDDLLLSYEREGFPMLIHADSQEMCFRPETEYRNVPECESLLVAGLQKMHRMGLTDYKMWCTPFGVHDADMVNLARKWGMECLVTSGYADAYESHISAPDGRFHIKRISIGYDASSDYAAQLETLKPVIDAAAAQNAWIIFSTHYAKVMDAARTGDFAAFMGDLLAYAAEKGVLVKTFNEEFRHRKPIYDLYDSF